ncbi:MAG TPA: glycosyltransferase [Bryobacteraceae bacterium]|nr:glycosyltransferase [Bryobacteraceae bacterium]
MTIGSTGPASGTAKFRFPFGLSVFFPAYNDAPSLPGLVDRTFETLRRVADDYEVIVVNDGSADDTAEILAQLEGEYAPFLRVVTHRQNRGYGAALRSGFAAATKEFIFYTDGDGQYDPAELEDLLRVVRPETGLVNGYKIRRHDPWHRVAIGWLYNRFARALFRIRLRDIDCDFRLIRRSILESADLRSTGGTICVELVRGLELSGADVIEIPVHHYPRQYGRSQFFRIRSLAITFLQLCAVYLRLVVAPAVRGAGGKSFSAIHAALVLLCITVVSLLAYGRMLSLPFISDDYVQIQLARDFGPISGWPALARDALYRCRATSMVLTYWLDSAFGLNAYSYNLASLALHILDSALVLALGFWRPVGWRLAALAACFFAVSERHSEAVVWFAAVPELLVFFFVMASFLCWVGWLQSATRSRAVFGASFVLYLLALLSKESAVALVPLLALAVVVHPDRPLRKLWGKAPFAVVAAGYFALAFVERRTHLHFNDGTFSLNAPLAEVLIRSVGGLMWIWGVVALLILGTKAARPWRPVIWVAGAWMLITLLPYSFLTYMPRVPSRHTYLASVGVACIVAGALLAVERLAAQWKKPWILPAAMAAIVLHQCGVLWTKKHYQYSQRAKPTEELLRVAGQRSGAIYANCFPYSPQIGELALQMRLNRADKPAFVVGPLAARQAGSIDFCNQTANGVHFVEQKLALQGGGGAN